MNIEQEARRQWKRERRQMVDDQAEAIDLTLRRLADHQRAAAVMRPAAPKKALKDMTNREFLAELERRHPWLAAKRRELRRGPRR